MPLEKRERKYEICVVADRQISNIKASELLDTAKNHRYCTVIRGRLDYEKDGVGHLGINIFFRGIVLLKEEYFGPSIHSSMPRQRQQGLILLPVSMKIKTQ
jgi:hypothetical protein